MTNNFMNNPVYSQPFQIIDFKNPYNYSVFCKVIEMYRRSETLYTQCIYIGLNRRN